MAKKIRSFREALEIRYSLTAKSGHSEIAKMLRAMTEYAQSLSECNAAVDSCRRFDKRHLGRAERKRAQVLQTVLAHTRTFEEYEKLFSEVRGEAETKLLV